MAKRKFKRSGSFYVYILQCQDGSFYTGYTPDLKKRLELHNKGKAAKYTRSRKPVKLAWQKEYKYGFYARRMEYRIKQLSKKHKQLLIGGIRLDKVLSKKNG
ncbi:MAG: GIY-YIG nuclease family protein [Candidatus Omnitrophota bacterium]|jgi:putative endonuclease